MVNHNLENLSSISTDTLDELDVQIIEQLKIDARQSLRAIASELDVSRETVRNRLNRLMSEDTLRIVCLANQQRLGYHFMLVVGIRARPGYTESVAKKLTDLPGVIHVSLAGNRYNIFMWALLRDQEELSQFVTRDLTSISNITSIEIMHSFNPLKEFWQVQTSETESPNSSSKDPLDELDMSIIKTMQQNPRQTFKELASSIGCSRQVASSRLETLIQEGTIGFIPMVNTTILGYSNWVVILLKAEPNKIIDITDHLSTQDTIWYVSLVTGQWQIYAVALFQDSRQSNNFATDTLNSIPGITEFEIIPLGRHVDFSFPLNLGSIQ